MTTSAIPSEVAHRLDACGLICPEPVMMLHNAVRAMKSGEVLEMLATDPSTERDVAKFCHYLGHDLLSSEQGEESGKTLYRYLLRKA